MGRGNLIPHDLYGTDYEMVYISDPEMPDNLVEECDEEDEDCETFEMYYQRAGEDNWQNIIDTVRDLLPKSFYYTDEWFTEREIARNTLLSICVADNEWSTAVIIRLRQGDRDEPFDGLAYRHMRLLAKRLFNGLYEIYKDRVRVRSSAWTSGPFTPSKEVAIESNS